MRSLKLYSAENGNALFLVLIAILLFAALGIAATKTSSNAPSSDQHEANIEVLRLLKWAEGVQSAVNTMILVQETTDTSISFEDPRAGQSGTPSAATNTENPNSRGEVDEVFANMVEWQDFSPGTSGLYTTFFNGQHAISGLGTSAADLVYFIPDINYDLCQAVNKKVDLGLTDATMPTDGTVVTAHFKGAYGSATVDNVDGKPFGCFLNTAASEYWFYYVILSR